MIWKLPCHNLFIIHFLPIWYRTRSQRQDRLYRVISYTISTRDTHISPRADMGVSGCYGIWYENCHVIIYSSYIFCLFDIVCAESKARPPRPCHIIPHINPRHPYQPSGWYGCLELICGMIWKLPCHNLFIIHFLPICYRTRSPRQDRLVLWMWWYGCFLPEQKGCITHVTWWNGVFSRAKKPYHPLDPLSHLLRSTRVLYA